MHVVDPALEIEGRVIPLARIMVAHEAREVWASIELYANAASADVERYQPGAADTRVRAPLPGAPWTTGIEACDLGAARTMARALAEVIRRPIIDSPLPSLASIVEADGWTVVEQRESLYDVENWELRACRARDQLELGLLISGLSGADLRAGEVVESVRAGSVNVVARCVFASVCLRSHTRALELAGALDDWFAELARR